MNFVDLVHIIAVLTSIVTGSIMIRVCYKRSIRALLLGVWVGSREKISKLNVEMCAF